MTGMRGIFCRARSPGGRAGSRKNCEKNPANCAAAVVSRARRRFSMGGVAYSAGRAVQEVGQEAGNIARKNPANRAADVLSRARRRFSMGVWT